jgi:hypothetical protein
MRIKVCFPKHEKVNNIMFFTNSNRGNVQDISVYAGLVKIHILIHTRCAVRMAMQKGG